MIPSNSACLDTSALIALLNAGKEPDRHRAVLEVYLTFKSSGMVFLPDVAFAEASAGMPSARELREALNEIGIESLQANDDALFLAGKVFLEYRRNSGTKDGVLPDFIIGATAVCNGLTLVTFNEKDFVNRFPDLKIVVPS